MEQRGIQRSVWGLIVCGAVQERKERGGGVPTEWVGLVGPVEAVGASGVLGEVVLGLVVVLEDLLQMEILVLRVLGLFAVGD